MIHYHYTNTKTITKMKNERERPSLGEENDELTLLQKTPFYTIGGYTVDVNKRLLTFNGETKRLTTKECNLIILFAANPNEFIDRKYTLKTIWKDDNYYNARSMDVYICKVRKLLSGDTNVLIINIHGKGYKMIVPA